MTADYDALLRLARARRSPYAFDIDAPVSDDALRAAFEVARWAPSSYNEQPWRFVAGRKGDAAYRAVTDALLGQNPAWALTAPVLGLVVASERFALDDSANTHAGFDTGAACFGLALGARAVGLGLHLMAGVDVAKAADGLGVPDGFEAVAGFALGVPAADPLAVVPEPLARRALSPKPRRPLGETVFGRWGEPLLGDRRASIDK